MTEYSGMRSCFVIIREAVQPHLSDTAMLASFSSAGGDVSDLFDQTGSVPITQDSLAGFVKTFTLSCGMNAPDDIDARPQSKPFAVIGATYLLALAAPVSCALITRNGIYHAGFWDLDTEAGDPETRIRTAAAGEELIQAIFKSMPDVPVTAESLAGLVLGMRYGRHLYPQVPDHVLDGIELAARGIALRCGPHAIP
jgi:hypothetical protein